MEIYRPRYPSLEIDWLPNSIRKGLVTPTVVYTDCEDYGGCYWWQGDYARMDISAKKRPILEIATCSSPAATIAHEYRHHWQRHNARLDPTAWDTGADYQQSIVSYFRTSWSEYDALRFELKMAPNDVNLQWAEWLHHAPNLFEKAPRKGLVKSSQAIPPTLMDK